MVNLGDKAKDRVTGFEGIVIAKTEWLNKCVRVYVQPQQLHEGTPVKAQEFDEEQLELLETDAVVIGKEVPTGGDKGFTPSRN